MFKRKLSYIVINIEEMSSIEKENHHMRMVIKKITNEQNLFIVFYNYLYYCINYYIFSYFKIQHFHWYKANEISINNTLKIDKTLSFYIFDNGVQFYGKAHNYFIPYEYITEFSTLNNNVRFNLFATFTKDPEENIKMEFSSERSIISFNVEDNSYIIKYIKSNMRYHILYNKIDKKVLNYYLSKQD